LNVKAKLTGIIVIEPRSGDIGRAGVSCRPFRAFQLPG
jgi:hypothetical protein